MYKIAFLFLTLSNIYHESYWKKFFAGNQSRFSIYVHSKYAVTSSFFKKHTLKRRVATDWAHTMNAQIELLREALKDKHNQKFIFVSESTIPLRSFNKIYKHLMAHPYSEFVMGTNHHLDRSRGGYSFERMVRGIGLEHQKKHTQWVILNRKHAKLLIKHARLLEKPVYCDNEHFVGTVLSFEGKSSEVKRKNCTYVCWNCLGARGIHPYLFKDLSRPEQLNLLTGAISAGYLFARKIDKACDLRPLDSYLSYVSKR